jgi:hypothetical protein
MSKCQLNFLIGVDSDQNDAAIGVDLIPVHKPKLQRTVMS